MTRLATGIQGFDAMVHGGLPVGSSVVLQGPPGQEKLRFALTFLAEGLKAGASGLVVISSQSPNAVLAELRGLGVDLDAVTKEDRLRIVDWYSWSEEAVHDIEERGLVVRSSIDLTNLGVAMSRAMAALSGDQVRRAVIELLSPATNVYEISQVYAFAQSAKKKFDRYEFTSLVLLEKDMHSAPELTTLHQPFDGVIEIERTRSGDRIVRKIGVLHLKETAPDPTFRVLEVAESSLRVIRDAPKPVPPASAGPSAGTVLESQDERAHRLTLIMQIAGERLKLNPRDTDALFAMAAAQATLDDSRGGLQSLDRLAELDPNYPGLWVLKTKLHARLGDAERARQSRIRSQQAESMEAQPAEPTVPCPMCEAPVSVAATVCGNCGVKFTPARKLEDELEDLGHAAIQEMVEEGLREQAPPSAPRKPVERKPPEPKPPIQTIPPAEVALPPKPTPKPMPKKGLTNGLALSRRGGRRLGLTNGLRGRTNGLRGRTNGLTNGGGRTNGLTNGLGHTNGLTNGRGRTNGLTNGLGRTNGITNGLGRTNGITNGLGRTNGLTNGLGGLRSAGFRATGIRGMMRTAGWKLYMIPLVVVGLLLVPLFFVPEYNGPAYPIRIDGQFGDWAAVSTEAMGSGVGLNPNVDVVRFGVVDNLGPVAFYVQVAGTALQGGGASPGTMDSVRIFVDTDGSSATGYRIDGLGADRLIEVSGYAGLVRQSTLWEFDANRDTRDWGGWIKGTGTPAAATGSQIEAEAEWLVPSEPAIPVVATVHTASWDGQDDIGEFPISPSEGSLSIVADPQVPDVITGNGISLLRLTITGHGQAVSIDSLDVQIAGTAPPTAALSLRLTDGAAVLDQVTPTTRDVSFSFPARSIGDGATSTLSVEGDFSGTGGDTFGIRLPSAHPFGLAAGAVGLRENPGTRTLGYLGSAPSTPRVDGGFDEWSAVATDPAADVSPRANRNIDLLHEGAQASGGSTFLYADVTGRILQGTSVPERAKSAPVQGPAPAGDTDRDTVPDSPDPFPLDFNNDGTPDAQTNGDYDGDGITDYGFIAGTDSWLNTTIPSTFPAPYAGRSVSVYIGPTYKPPALGEDVLRTFLDLDNSSASGYAIGGIGADRLVEIRGKDGQVTQSAFLSFAGSFPGQWAWTPLAPVTVALGYDAVELAVPVNAANVHVEAGDFWGSSDSTAAVPAFTIQTSSFKASAADHPLSVPWTQVGPEPAATLIDSGSNVATTLYNQQRKVVRAGTAAGATPCDATNSAGCWYVVFRDQVTPADSAFKDGANTAIPTTLGLVDSISTSLAAGDNLLVVAVQIDNIDTVAHSITAGNLQLRRGTTTSDPLVSQTAFDIWDREGGAAGAGMFAVLLGKDASAPANPTYGVFAADSTAKLKLEIKFLVLNSVPNSAFGDGASTAVGGTETTLLSQATTLPAGDNVVIAAVQYDSTSGSLATTATNLKLKSGATVLASNQFDYGASNNGLAYAGSFALLIARDAGASANPTYSVTGLASAGTGNGEAKLLAFNGLTSSIVDTASVAISTSRTVIGTATTTFATGDDAVIGAIHLQGITASAQAIAVGADDIRRTGDTSASSNEIIHRVAPTGTQNRETPYEFYVRKVTTTAANPSYEGAATAPSASAINGELKLVAIHVRDTIPDSAFKDGTSAAVPTSIGDLDSIATTLAAGDNLVVATIQLDNTVGTSTTIAAGNLQLVRTGSPDVTLSQNQNTINVAQNANQADGRFAVLLGRDAGAPASPTYRIRAAAAASGVNGEVKFVIIHGPGNSAFGDSANVVIGTSETTVLDVAATGFPAASTSLPNIIVAVVQLTGTGTAFVNPGNLALKRVSPSATLASNEFDLAHRATSSPYYGRHLVLVAVDTAAGAAPTYRISEIANSASVGSLEAKMLVFQGFAAASVDTGNVSIGTSRTVIGSVATNFAAGDDVVIGAMDGPTPSIATTIAAGAADTRLQGGASADSANEFTETTGVLTATDAGAQFTLPFKKTTTAASPTYEAAAASPNSIGLELKLVAIHIRDATQGWDRVVLRRSLDTSGSTWGAPIILASGNSLESPLLYAYDSSEPSIAIDSAGYLHVTWVSASAGGEQSVLNLVRYTKTTAAYPTQAQLADSGNWQAVTGVDDTNPGYMPTVSTDSSNSAHIAWSSSKTSGTVYYKHTAASTADSAFKDGTSVAIPTSIGDLDSIATTLAAGDNVIVAVIQVDNTVGSSKTVSANNLQLVRTGSPDVLLSQNAKDMVFAADAGTQDGKFAVLLGRDAGAPANPTYRIRAAASATGLNGEVKFVVIHAPGNSAFGDGADVAIGATETTVLDVAATGFPAASTSLPNIIVGVVQHTSTVDTIDMLAGNLALKRVSPLATLASNQFTIRNFNTVNGEIGKFSVLVAIDTAAGAAPTYRISAIASATGPSLQGKMLVFQGFAAASVDTGSVAIGTTRTVLGSVATTFAAGDDIVMGAVSVQNPGTATTIAAGAVDTRLQGGSADSENQFSAYEVTNVGRQTVFTLPFKKSTTAANPTYEGAAASPNAINGELKLVAIHIKDSWKATVSWGTTYTGISVDVSPQNDYVSIARYYEAATNEIQYTVCKDLATSTCDASTEFTKADGTAGYNTVDTSVETGAYPSLATTYEANGDLWISYAKPVGGDRAIYARFLDYPSNGFAAVETVDSLAGTQFTRPAIGVDKDGNVHALYVAISGPQLYYNSRFSGVWGSRTAVDTTSDSPSIMVRAPNDATYGGESGAVYWKSSTSETYFYRIPEFETILLPLLGVLPVVLVLGRRRLKAGRSGAGGPHPSAHPMSNPLDVPRQ